MEELQRQNRDKSLKIAQLESIIRKLSGQVKEKDQKVQSLQSLLKERTNKINKLNVEFFKMEQELIEFHKIKEAFVEQDNRIQEQILKLQRLEQIIQLQCEQIENYAKDQQHYVKFVEEMYQTNQGWFEERGLLYEYQTELERQVGEVEDINQKLISTNEEYGNEMQQQNEQGNDLLGQIQYMIECCEGVQ